jgi:hypothetical protein
MAMKKGYSSDVMHSNIHEMVKSGRSVKESIAAALAKSRKYKKMAMGGMVEEGSEEDYDPQEGSKNVGGDMGMPGKPLYPMGEDEQGLDESVSEHAALIEGLQKERYAANQNTHDFKEGYIVKGSPMSKSGVKQSDEGMPQGNKPDLAWIDAGTEDSMSAAKKIIEEKRKKRLMMRG